MRTIQEVGKEILTHNPQKFYVLLGDEYGIKSKYIEELKRYYNDTIIESESVSGLLSSMQSRQLIPRKPSLYVVRYDLDFLKSLSDTSESLIDRTNIVGTIVCIYEDTKCHSKFEKFLSKYSVVITDINPAFIANYIKSDFPNLSDRMINLAVRCGINYGRSQKIAYMMSLLKEDSDLYRMSDSEICETFGIVKHFSERDIKFAIASRNIMHLLTMSDSIEDVDSFIYNICSVMLELDKVKRSKYTNSEFVRFANSWTVSDIYNMFNQAYNQLITLRSKSFNTIGDCVLYLIALLGFGQIPSLGDTQ